MKKAILLTIIALALSSHAFGQSSTATSNATVNVDNRVITLVNLGELNFGSIMPFATSGSITVSASNGSFTASNLHVSDSSAIRRSVWEVSGVPGAPFSTTLPNDITVSNGTDSMTITDFTRAGFTTLNDTGVRQIGVGGTLNVAGNQAPGTYTGTFDVTVNYP